MKEPCSNSILTDNADVCVKITIKELEISYYILLFFTH